MERVKVLPGQQICERGLWFYQGSVLDVESAAVHGKAVAPTTDAINITPGLFPEPVKPADEPAAPAAAAAAPQSPTVPAEPATDSPAKE